MHNPNSILNQLQQILPMNEFQQFVGQHEADKYSKKLKCKNQLSVLLYAQATGKDSLREIETSLLVEHNIIFKSWKDYPTNQHSSIMGNQMKANGVSA